MTAAEIQTKYTSEKLREFGFVTAGTITLGDTTFLFQRNHDNLFSLEPVDKNTQLSYFRSQTERLNSKNHINIPNVDATQVSLLQYNPRNNIGINWIETTSGADKPEIELPTTNTILFDDKTIEFSEELLTDLFLPRPSNKQATFFSMETADLEVIGIAIRNQSPKIIFLPPVIDAGRPSTIQGLNSFLEKVYLSLRSKSTHIQNLVDNAIFEATLPTNKKLVFAAEDTKKTLADAHKKIYQIQGLLLALRANIKLGTQDPSLLHHAPFLKTQEKRTGIAALLKQDNTPQSITVDHNIWTKLLTEPKEGLIVTGPRSTRQQTVVTLNPRQQAPTTASEHTRQTNRQEVSEKQKAIGLSQDLDTKLKANINQFKDASVDILGMRQIKETEAQLEAISKAAEIYMGKRKRGKGPNTPTPSNIRPQKGTINIGGIKDEQVYNFLTSSQNTDPKTKVTSAISIMRQTILPIFQSTNSKQERQISNMKSANHLLRIAGLSDSLLPEIEKIARLDRKTDLPVAEAGYIILCTQVVYTLWARLQELKNNGNEIEIDNWVNFCYSASEEIRQIAKTILPK